MAKGSIRKEIARLLYASTAQSADMLYFGGVDVPDPFIAFELGGKKYAVLSRLEIARVTKEGDFDQTISLEALVQEVLKKGGKGSIPEVIASLVKSYPIRGFIVPDDFPAGVAFALKDLGIQLEVSPGLLFPEREFKTDTEALAIKEGNAASSAGFKVVEGVLREAKVGRGHKLYYNGRILTSESLQQMIEIACLERGAVSSNTIVAGGDQACDPHCRGSGPLRANELIIVDIFPRVTKTGFHGDMTRTYLKGRASEAQRALVSTVFEAQQMALARHVARASGRKIYDDVCTFFQSRDYRTEVIEGTPVGFFHGLGHGLGLDVHEPPRVNAKGTRLKKGQVITVEPGLYYPGLGGCRIEDVIRVQVGTPELLSKHGYRWEIR